MFLREKLIVSARLRKEMLNLVHESHKRIVKTKARAREVMYWPGMTRDIKDTVTRCSQCAYWHIIKQKTPIIPHEVPTRPWQNSEQFCVMKGQNYYVIKDYL